MLALAAALASAAVVTPATAADRVTGSCEGVLTGTTSGFPAITLAAYATTTVPALEVGVACWVAEGGAAYANANNPGVAVVAAGTGVVYRLDFTLCQQRWARWADGTTYTSPIACV